MDWSGPHSPDPRCPRCFDLFRDTEPETLARLERTDHLPSCDALILRPRTLREFHPGWLRRWRKDAGQSIVEFALVFPILCTMLLGLVEIGLLGYWVQRYQDGAEILAALGIDATDPAWPEAVRTVSAEVSCGAPVADLTVHADGGYRTVSLRCEYVPLVYGALAVPVSVEASVPEAMTVAVKE